MQQSEINRIQLHFEQNIAAIITAFRQECTLDENIKRNAKLKKTLDEFNCGYISIIACYPEPHTEKAGFEKYFIVICNEFHQLKEEKDKLEESNDFKDKMLRLAYKYSQNSVIIRYYAGQGQFKNQRLGTDILPPDNPVIKDFAGNMCLEITENVLNKKTFSLDFTKENASRYNDFKTGSRWRIYSAAESSLKKSRYRI